MMAANDCATVKRFLYFLCQPIDMVRVNSDRIIRARHSSADPDPIIVGHAVTRLPDSGFPISAQTEISPKRTAKETNTTELQRLLLDKAHTGIFHQ